MKVRIKGRLAGGIVVAEVSMTVEELGVALLNTNAVDDMNPTDEECARALSAALSVALEL